MSTVICLTGMHRSGTSLTASWLERCGLQIHAGRMYEAADGNPKGHFEDVAMVDFQAGVLHRRGHGSAGWGLPGDEFLSFDAEQRARAEELLAERNRRFAVWAWKDPRSVLFLEQWHQLVPDLKVVLLWRPAAEVVESLVRRSRGSTNPDMRARALASIRLWRAYNRLVLAYRRRNMDSTLLLPLHRLVGSDRSAFDLLGRRFGLDLKYRPLAELFDPGLLRSSADSVRHRLIELGTRFTGCPDLERELLGASDTL